MFDIGRCPVPQATLELLSEPLSETAVVLLDGAWADIVVFEMMIVRLMYLEAGEQLQDTRTQLLVKAVSSAKKSFSARINAIIRSSDIGKGRFLNLMKSLAGTGSNAEEKGNEIMVVDDSAQEAKIADLANKFQEEVAPTVAILEESVTDNLSNFRREPNQCKTQQLPTQNPFNTRSKPIKTMYNTY